MKQWKEAYWLASFELEKSKLNLIVSLVISVLLTWYFIRSFSSYMDNGYIGFDIGFMILFSFITAIVKPKDFHHKTIYPRFMASPIVYLQTQLPIQESIIIRSRFIIHAMYTFPFQIIALLLIYFITPLSQSFSILSMIAFGAIWLTFNVCVGFLFAASDIGASGFFTTTTGLFLSGLISYFMIMLIFSMFHVLTGHGLVYWSVLFAGKWPIACIIISVLLSLAGYRHWTNYMKKKFRDLDYM